MTGVTSVPLDPSMSLEPWPGSQFRRPLVAISMSGLAIWLIARATLIREACGAITRALGDLRPVGQGPLNRVTR